MLGINNIHNLLHLFGFSQNHWILVVSYVDDISMKWLGFNEYCKLLSDDSSSNIFVIMRRLIGEGAIKPKRM